ncbi:mek-1, partial [Pristionchus pacificus]
FENNASLVVSIRGRRTASSDNRNRSERAESVSPTKPVPPSTPPPGFRLKPQLNLPIGAATSPLPRKVMERAAHLGITATPLILPPDDEMSPGTRERRARAQRLQEIKKKANQLRIFGEGQMNVNGLSELSHRRRIGEGNYGSVDEYTFRGQVMAVKRIFLQGGRDKENTKNVLMEISFCMADHKHENIVNSYGFLYFDDTFFICMERVASCLNKIQIRTRNEPVPHDILQRIMADVILGLKCLKENFNILHRDVKPSNILISMDGVGKICDFGIAGFLDNSLAHSENVGCPIYMAPERFDKGPAESSLTLNARNYDVRSDIWSVGITQVELARGRHPYVGGSEFEMISRMLDSPSPFIDSNDDTFSSEMAEFSQGVLTKDPRQRPKYPELVRYVYVINGMHISHEVVAEWLHEIMTIRDDDSNSSDGIDQRPVRERVKGVNEFTRFMDEVEECDRIHYTTFPEETEEELQKRRNRFFEELEWPGGLDGAQKLGGDDSLSMVSRQEEMNRRYEAVRAQANILRIGGKEVKIVRADVKDLKFIAEIGHGSCGHVSKYTYGGQLMAVKEMVKSANAEEMKRIIMDLDVVTKASDCPNIVHAYGYFITDEKVMVCMEVMATCLDRLLRHTGNTPVPEYIIGQIAVSVLTALDYLKEKHHIIHRDVKPSNILLDWNGVVKLCDFGISGNLIHSKVYTRQAGCPPYMAPERLNPNASPNYDIRSDVWSFGITMVELARGKYPYSNLNNEFDIFSEIMRGEPPVLTMDEGFSEEFVDFVSLLLQKEVEKRPKYNKLLNHPFIIRSKNEDTDVAEWFTGIMQLED